MSHRQDGPRSDPIEVVSLEAWNDVLSRDTTVDRFHAVLSEENGVARREHIRDIYHFLMAQQMLTMTQKLEVLDKKLTIRERPKANYWKIATVGVIGALAGATVAVCGCIYFRRN
jgi:hypothetical protein